MLMRNEFRTDGDITVIYVNCKGIILQAIIDTVDLPIVQSLRGTWFADYDSKRRSYYVNCGSAVEFKVNKNIKMHRLLTNAPKGMVVDHINHNGLDNRRSCNLRILTNGENIQNKKSSRIDSSSGVRGVSWDKRNKKWVVQIQVDGKKKHIGYFINIGEAEQAAIEARKKYMPYSHEALSS